jgi:hypothetical protein
MKYVTAKQHNFRIRETYITATVTPSVEFTTVVRDLGMRAKPKEKIL